MWRDLNGETDLPEHFVNAQTLAPSDHVKMQAAAQEWVDSSISKTINCPEDISFEAFKDVYMQAYETGCKGCTTYRPNAVTGSVLSVGQVPGTQQKSFGEALKSRMRSTKKRIADVVSESGLSRDVVNKLIYRVCVWIVGRGFFGERRIT
jgi:ribonucleoside-diphosphate reductase alpha chain